ncbi:Eukaryotic elongation factor-2 kinase [Puccinia graminis f. sp. tritici]|uniref:Eukaryotic elongation factor-2 kinase n=1 Tax=Puccinia graminis f. sp. tritici TaxID=56615 RepID=A0A5B0NP64_PUCGR|nr:Eukaryotic elongation factor-2 kinase [Puccinia graminis f. sp. tritici]KAA1110592.1 Eukaryotic elongation factor-2 kinase [Puccinia graminis f. sp. tritici]
MESFPASSIPSGLIASVASTNPSITAHIAPCCSCFSNPSQSCMCWIQCQFPGCCEGKVLQEWCTDTLHQKEQASTKDEHTRIISGGIAHYYQLTKLNKNTGICSHMLPVNIDSPNLYEDLQQLHISLSHNQNVLDLSTLSLLVKDPTKELPTSINTSTSASRSNRITCTRATPHNPKDLASNDTWALGGTGGTILALGDASLSTRLNNLGKPLSASININPKGWVLAQRLKFNSSDSDYVRSQASHVYQYFHATMFPITNNI